MSLNLNTIIESIEQVIDTAKGMISNEIGVIEGSRILAALTHKVTGTNNDQDFITFIHVEEGTEHVPLGNVRNYYSKESLRKIDMEKAALEERYRARVLESCVQLLGRYRNKPSPKISGQS